MLLRFYILMSIILSPLFWIILYFRKLLGKEDKKRIRERFGYGSIKRPQGKLVWFHAASVGESLSILSIMNNLRSKYPDLNILLTTGTVSSAKLMLMRMPKGVMHQYVPVDSYNVTKRFLENWQPDLSIFVESELWPNLICSVRDYGSILLINARMSEGSYKFWKLFHGFIKPVLLQFSSIIAQGEIDKIRYQALGSKNVKSLGNLKYAAEKLQADEFDLNILMQEIDNRPVFLAASTHEGDENIIANAHRFLKFKFPELLTIIVPRHPRRANKIIDILKHYKLTLALRSNHDHITKQTDIYLANTIGEMGLFYSLANIIFIGGSFKNGGHNPIEAAHFNALIMFGPDMSNFSDVSSVFAESNAVVQISSVNDLITKLDFFLDKANHDQMQQYISNAHNIIAQHNKIIDNYMHLIEEYLP